MSLLRALADYYAAQSGLIVPAERFTEGMRPQTDVLPAITYQRTGEPEDFHQRGSGLAKMAVRMTAWGQTPGQAGRIRDELRHVFHLLNNTAIGSGQDQTLVLLCVGESTTDNAGFPQDGGPDFSCGSSLFFEFTYRPAAPANA